MTNAFVLSVQNAWASLSSWLYDRFQLDATGLLYCFGIPLLLIVFFCLFHALLNLARREEFEEREAAIRKGVLRLNSKIREANSRLDGKMQQANGWLANLSLWDSALRQKEQNLLSKKQTLQEWKEDLNDKEQRLDEREEDLDAEEQSLLARTQKTDDKLCEIIVREEALQRRQEAIDGLMLKKQEAERTLAELPPKIEALECKKQELFKQNQEFEEHLKAERNNWIARIRKVNVLEWELGWRKDDLDSREKEVARKEQVARERAAETFIDERLKGFPSAARQWAEFQTKIYGEAEHWLRTKAHPAPSAAETVREFGKRAAEAERRAFMWRGIAGAYEEMVPSLAELREEPEVYMPPMPRSDDEDRDPACEWLPEEEWKSLSEQKRYQLALDRWKKRRRTSWEAGREYERFVGYLYERDGWDVSYDGALKGKEDLGRDLVAKKYGKTLIVQCKRWAAGKTVHEKHVIQLFGTCVLYDMEQGFGPGRRSQGVLACTCGISEKARECAERLGIEIRDNLPLKDFPAVKCNVSASGEKIFHLPFDQQYDRTKITLRKGECFCWTVKEAMDKGFRRAFRWRGGDKASS